MEFYLKIPQSLFRLEKTITVNSLEKMKKLKIENEDRN